MTLVADGQEDRDLQAGDAFVMQEGFRREWRVAEYVKKYFVITQTGR